MRRAAEAGESDHRTSGEGILRLPEGVTGGGEFHSRG